jgi:hypothetical protein
MDNSQPKSNLQDKVPQQNSKLQDDMADAQLRKLNLEISALEWQNSRIGRFSRFATFITIGATLVTILATLFGSWYGWKKDRDVRANELIERNDNQYRSDVQQLLQYRFEDKQTLPSVLFSILDLNHIVENKYEGAEQSRRKNELGLLFTRIVKASEFDLTKDRNVEFDRVALRYCPYYPDYLKHNPRFIIEILSKYGDAIASLNTDKAFEALIVKPETYEFDFPVDLKEPFKISANQGANIVNVYRSHVSLLKQSLEVKSEAAEETKKNMIIAFCLFYSRTKNKELTKYVFQIDESTFQNNINSCK